MKRQVLFIAALLLLLSACGGTKTQTEGTDAADSTVVEAKEDTTSVANEPQKKVQKLTFADVEGIYDSFNEDGGNESRIGLQKDGTATWCMIGSLNYTEYTYTIQGNTICMKVEGVDTEEECYDYDPRTRTLKNEQGAVYYRQDIDETE